MGISERKDRERQAVTASMSGCGARELFVSEGYPNVSIRKIAEKIEYSPAAIYSYFASKDDIFLALADEGFHLLDAKVRRAQVHTDALENVRSGW
jgi:AcrR family transcriptional regulator